MSASNSSGSYLTTSDLVDRYKRPNGKPLFSDRTLASWRRDGKGPKFIKPEGRPLYPLEEVETWEQEAGLSPAEK